MAIRSIPNPTAIPQPPIPKKRETPPPREPEPDIDFSAYESDESEEPIEEPENIEINPNGNPLNAKVSKPPKKFNVRTILMFLIGGVMLFGIGLYIASKSKSATNFDDFYWSIIQANVLLCFGLIVLYSEIKADVYPLVMDRFSIWKKNR